MAPNFKAIPPAPASLKMDTILAKMAAGDGLLRSARFAVQINPWNLLPLETTLDAVRKDLVYLCEVAEFPGRTFMNSDIRYYGPSVKFPFQTVYEDVNFTFLCRAKSQERLIFDSWMEMINPIDTYDFNYKNDYSTDIDIFQLDEQYKSTYAITLLQAYPIQISPQPVTWADDNFQRLAVTFTYSKWGRKGIDYEF